MNSQSRPVSTASCLQTGLLIFASSIAFDKNSVSLSTYVPGSEAERKLLRKIDLRIVPCIWILYCVSYLDRANIGNARSGGMEADLGFDSNQYSIILVVFFISYVLFEVPRYVSGVYYEPSLMLCSAT
jgi:sugar phosphate permease